MNEEKQCKDCRFARLMGYNQVICGKRNQWRVEPDTCDWWEPRGKESSDGDQAV